MPKKNRPIEKKYGSVWERRKLGATARDAATSETITERTLVKRDDIDPNEFIQWVQNYGNHSYVYILRIVEVVIDEQYDPASGMVKISIGSPTYRSVVHRKDESWGINRYGNYNFLPDFDWKEYVPKGYPKRRVYFNDNQVEEVDS